MPAVRQAVAAVGRGMYAPRVIGLSTLAGLVLAALLWIVIAPVQVGGQTAYMTTNGNSMEPLLEPGELAITRRPRPKTGAYRSRSFCRGSDPERRRARYVGGTAGARDARDPAGNGAR